MTHRIPTLLGLTALIALTVSAAAQPITIDGVFFDWDDTYKVDNGMYEELTFSEGDPNTPDAENPAYWVDLDIKDLYAIKGSDSLYVRVVLNEAANITNTLTDTSYHGGGQLVLYFDLDNSNATGLTWDWWASGYDLFVQVFPSPYEDELANRAPVFEHTQDGHGWGWIQLEDTTAAHYAWNAEFNEVEIAVPLGMLRNPVNLDPASLGDHLAMLVFGSEPEGPWRADTAPSLPASQGLPYRINTPADPIAIDGVFFDWDDTFKVDNGIYEELTFSEGDPNTPDAENPSYWVDLDIKDLYAVQGSDSLYVRVVLNEAANITNTLADTSYHGGGQLVLYFDLDNSNETGLTWDWWASGYDVFVQVFPSPYEDELANRAPVFEHTQDGHGWGWIQLEDTTAAHYAWNAEFNEVEVAVPLSTLRNPVMLDPASLGDHLALLVFGSEPEGPWRADTAPSLPASQGLPFRIGEVAVSSEGDAPHATPQRFHLLGNYPNPFNPATTIRFALERPADVRVRVFDLLGRQVALLADQTMAAGTHDLRFDASGLPSGLYLYQVETGREVRSALMTLLK